MVRNPLGSASGVHVRPVAARPAGEHLPSIFDVLENTTDYVAILDHNWRFTFLNRHAAEILGEGRNLVGKPLHDYFMPEKGTPAWQQTVKAAETRQSAHFEFYASKLGVWFETHVHPIPSGLQIFFRDVTARKAADYALQEGEARLRLALEAAGDGAWDWDLATGRVSMSTKIVKRLGYGEDRFDGAVAEFTPIIHKHDGDRIKSALVAHLTGRTESYSCEYRVRSRDSTWRWLSVRGRVIARDEATSRATRMVGIASDITDRKAAEQKAAEQADLLSLAQRGAGAGAWSFNFSTLEVLLEPHAVALLGLPRNHPGTVTLQEWRSIIAPADHVLMKTKFDEVMATGDDFAVEYRVILHDGRTRWIQSVGSRVQEANSGTHRLIGLILDVTDRKNAADALRESEERLRLALEAAGDGAWEYNLVTNATIPSKRLLAKLGYAAESFPTTLDAYTALIHPDDVQASVTAFQSHLRGLTDAYSTEYRIRAASGDWLWFSDRGRVVARDPVTGYATRIVGTHSEITEKKCAELELNRVQGELVHLSRLSAMGAMASTLAHELNQPLTAIANYAQGIRRAVPLKAQGDPLVDEALTGMEQSAQRAGKIVRSLRAYVTKGDVEQRPESVDAIIKDACALGLVDATALGIDYEIDTGGRLPRVLVDKVQIQQVVLNLVRNGVEATQGQNNRKLRVSARVVGREMEVRVRDNGAGIPESIRGQLFTPFASTKTTGMGVGLSICRTIVEAHGGRIWAEDETDRGTCFCFALPVHQSRRGASRQPASLVQ